MPAAINVPVNRLINALPHKERMRFLRRCERVELMVGAVLCKPGRPFAHIYFPQRGFISVLASVSGHRPLEIALIGSEGMLGAPLVLEVDTLAPLAIVQGAGSALRITAAHFQNEVRRSAALRRVLQRYLDVWTAQLSQLSVCNRFHEVGPRLARWLLMAHDRAHADHFVVTHELVADVLGARRSGITVAAGLLQGLNVIRYARGKISVLNRPVLEASACECYAAMAGDYARQFPRMRPALARATAARAPPRGAP